MLLLLLYLVQKFLVKISAHKFFPKRLKEWFSQPLSKFYSKSVKFLEGSREETISRINLIDLSVRNMKAKKTRTAVTIGGMTIGIGIIVFLVSVGYGLQELVVSKVARLEEMRQTDVVPQTGGNLKINDKTLSDFKNISSVEKSLPLIAVVGRVSYQSSVSDMAVYGVTTDYLKESAIKPIKGKVFENNEISMGTSGLSGQVAGVSTDAVEEETGAAANEVGQVTGKIEFSINPSSWIRVRANPGINAEILGYTKRMEGVMTGEEVWGGKYLSKDNAGNAGKTDEGKTLGKWIKSPVFLWKEEVCSEETNPDCENNHVVLREDGAQVQEIGYFAEVNLKIVEKNINEPKVLGLSDENDAVGENSLEWVDVASESAAAETTNVKTVELSSGSKREAVVNMAMLSVLGINESDAVGEKFNSSFVVVGDLLGDANEKVESASIEYTIVGVIPDEKTPVFYVPFTDLRELGITNYSQVKVVVKDQNELAELRKQIEAMGFTTRSVADTVKQINSLFASARTILGLLGMVALAVAALGMFNTLTVSLLERTREVGLMKAMGMKSSEVQELFLTESMIMGFLGGVLGIIAGLILGKFVSLVLSVFSIIKGIGIIDVSHIPLPFIILVILLSLAVGVTTGIYPSLRAKRISALNSLRYE